MIHYCRWQADDCWYIKVGKNRLLITEIGKIVWRNGWWANDRDRQRADSRFCKHLPSIHLHGFCSRLNLTTVNALVSPWKHKALSKQIWFPILHQFRLNSQLAALFLCFLQWICVIHTVFRIKPHKATPRRKGYETKEANTQLILLSKTSFSLFY